MQDLSQDCIPLVDCVDCNAGYGVDEHPQDLTNKVRATSAGFRSSDLLTNTLYSEDMTCTFISWDTQRGPSVSSCIISRLTHIMRNLRRTPVINN